MKRVILALTIFLTAIVAANAQSPSGVQLGAGIRFAAPSASFAKEFAYGVGVEGQMEFGLVKKLSGIVTTGYTHFVGKDYGITPKRQTIGYIPLLAGVRLYPVNKLFLGAQAGYSVFTGHNITEGGFSYQTQIGYNADNFQLAGSYNAFTQRGNSLGHYALSGIFKFGSNKRR